MTRKIRAGSDLRHDVRYIYIYIYRNKENSQQTRLCGARSGSPQLDKCRTLWGEPERVQLSNVHEAVACACVPTWSRCMCMTVSACHQNVTESTRTRSYDTKNTPVHFTATVNQVST